MNRFLLLASLVFLLQDIRAQLTITDPQSQEVCAGSNVSFSCTVSPETAVLQWQRSENNGTDWIDIINGGVYSGANDDELVITGASQGMHAFLFRLVATDTEVMESDTSDVAMLTVYPLPVFTHTIMDPTACVGAGSTGSFTLQGLNAGEGYVVHYTHNMTQDTLSGTGPAITVQNLPEGTYSNIFVVHQVTQCTSSTIAPIQLVPPPSPSISTVTGSPVTTCGGTNGSLTIMGSFMNGQNYTVHYTHNMTQASAEKQATATNIVVDGLATGSYTNIKVVHQATQCESNTIAGAVEITGPSVPVITSVTPGHTTECGSSDGKFTIAGSFITSGDDYLVYYTHMMTSYSDTVSATGPTITVENLSSGAYSNIRVVHMETECASLPPYQSTTIVDPGVPPIPTIEGGMNEVCGNANTSFMATGNPQHDYVWTLSGSGVIQGNGQQNITIDWEDILPPNSPQTVTLSVMVTDNNECSNTHIRTITIHARPSVSIPAGTPTHFCQGGSVVLNATSSPGSTITWQPGNNTNPITVNMGGTYTAIATSSSPVCTSNVATISIEEAPNPTVGIGVTDNSGATGDNILCLGDTIQLTAQPQGGATPYSYAWSPDGTDSTKNVTAGGTYSAIVTDNKGCKGSNAISITHHQKPAPPMVTSPVLYCVDEVADTLKAVGMKLKWDGMQGPAPKPMTSMAGTRMYKVTQTVNTCESATPANIQVTVYANPSFEIQRIENSGHGDDDDKVCSRDTVTLKAIASDTYAYTWSNGPTGDTYTVVPDFINGSSFAYTVTGTQTHQDEGVKTCSTPRGGSIEVFDNPVAGYSTDPASLNNIEADQLIAFLDISTNGISSDIKEWHWDFGNNAEPSEELKTMAGVEVKVKYNTKGSYSACLKVIDGNNCNNDVCKNVNVLDPNGPDVFINAEKQSSCVGDTVWVKATINARNSHSWKLLNNVTWEIEPGGYTILSDNSTSFSETQLIRELRVIFNTNNDYSIKVFGYQMEKVGMNPATAQNEATTSVYGGDPIPFIESINYPGEVCEGAELQLDIKLNLTNTARLTYKVNNGSPSSIIDLTNGMGVIKTPSQGLESIHVDFEELALVSLANCKNGDPAPDVVVQVLSNPSLFLDPYLLICTGYTGTVTVSSDIEASYLWTTDWDTVSITNLLEIDAGNNIDTITYMVTGTSEGGCIDTASIDVIVVPQPDPHVSGKANVCADQVIGYSAEGIRSGSDLTWSVSQGGTILSDDIHSDHILVQWKSSGKISLNESIGTCYKDDNLDVLVSNTKSPPYTGIVYLPHGGILLYLNPEQEKGLCYQWYKDGAIDTGEIFQGKVIGSGQSETERERYSVKVYYCDNEECGQRIVYSRSVAEDDTPALFSMRVAPNPNDGRFDLRIIAPMEERFSLSLYTPVGQPVWTQHIDVLPGTTVVPVDVSFLPAGIYYLRRHGGISGDAAWTMISIVH